MTPRGIKIILPVINFFFVKTPHPPDSNHDPPPSVCLLSLDQTTSPLYSGSFTPRHKPLYVTPQGVRSRSWHSSGYLTLETHVLTLCRESRHSRGLWSNLRYVVVGVRCFVFVRSWLYDCRKENVTRISRELLVSNCLTKGTSSLRSVCWNNNVSSTTFRLNL